ncbi:hypothetical protein EOPP23_20425 [Endozoicomonas sp. OPT23]|uniref:hypothetical protein n=1 Tax=Endozoicomonas sp. OPT23 TaxID=2072845 RepID=UPI00129AEF4B|nr:hypothetical protein [Endozoicomonas sp. OPT23]MRI35328.1 hypothetical protein [Endozoicomonas sp. OPT23]
MVDKDGNKSKGLNSNELWSLFLSKGGTVRQLRSISDEHLESIYQKGYGHFETGHYKEALTIFRYLAIMDHRESRYFLAMGLSLSHLNQDSAAIAPLEHATRCDSHDPRATLAMVECFIKLKNRRLAELALRDAARTLKSVKGWTEERAIAAQLQNFLTGEAVGGKQ